MDGEQETQQVFLRNAMKALDMTYDQFAGRLRIKRKTLENWLAVVGASDHRKMPDIARAFVEEILKNAKRP
jgi:aspartate carbamoyltransferase catalytic subunit